MTRLRGAAGEAPFIFVVGKGGVGKTTTAGALALELADDAGPTHLISTDPAHSLADLFGQHLAGRPEPADCAPDLMLEEFDATARADDWIGRSMRRVADIVERGTYLDGDDVAAFSRLALPGVDELMAVLRLTDLAGADRRIVVDTAPTGHTLRMLDAVATLDGLAAALRAMADKAAAVAGGLTGRPLRLVGESVIDELRGYVDGFRQRVLDRAVFVVTDRPGAVVAAETRRLEAALSARALSVAAKVTTVLDAGEPAGAAGRAVHLMVPDLGAIEGCDGLRAWRAALQPYTPAAGGSPDAQSSGARSKGVPPDEAGRQSPAPAREEPALPWLVGTAPRMLLFAGKGGVGKSTCAAAAALALADSRDVLLCSADPAGSLDDVLAATAGGPIGLPPRLSTLQIQPEAELARLRELWDADLDEALQRIGLSASAALDRRVIEELTRLVPPGIDELAAIVAMRATAESSTTVVLDTAPTGHLLRLLGTPAVALDWTRQVMRLVVKYGLSGAGGLAGSLVRLSRELRSLQDTLHDETATAAIVVALDEPMVTAETERLLAGLRGAGVHVAAVLHNRTRRHVPGTGTHRPAEGWPLAITAPVMASLTGEDALREFVAAWNIVR